MVDQTVLSAKGDAKKAMIGTIAASGQADTWDDPGWQAFVKAYQDAFPPEKRFPSPCLLATNYYGATMAMIRGAEQGQRRPQRQPVQVQGRAGRAEIDAPNGKISLDSNRQAIGTNFVTEVVDDGKGALFSKVVKVIPEREPDARLRPGGLRQDRASRAAPIRSARSTDRKGTRPGARWRPAVRSRRLSDGHRRAWQPVKRHPSAFAIGLRTRSGSAPRSPSKGRRMNRFIGAIRSGR